MAPAPPPRARAPRAHFLDRVRTLLTAVVIVHHCAYVTTMDLPLRAGWTVPSLTPFALVRTPAAAHAWQATVLHWLQNIDQAYFMTLFFALAGYCSPKSLARKGGLKFVADRALRLIVPAMFYAAIVFPASLYVAGSVRDRVLALPSVGVAMETAPDLGARVASMFQPFDAPYASIARLAVATKSASLAMYLGPMWFTVTLFYFSAAYAAISAALRSCRRAAVQPDVASGATNSAGADVECGGFATALGNAGCTEDAPFSACHLIAGCAGLTVVLWLASFAGAAAGNNNTLALGIASQFEFPFICPYAIAFAVGVWAHKVRALDRLPTTPCAVMLAVGVAWAILSQWLLSMLPTAGPLPGSATYVRWVQFLTMLSTGSMVAVSSGTPFQPTPVADLSFTPLATTAATTLCNQSFAVLFSVGMLGVARCAWNAPPGRAAAATNGAAFSAYIMHPFWLTVWTAALVAAPAMAPLPQALALAAFVVPASFAPRALATLAAPLAARATPRLQQFYADTFLAQYRAPATRTVHYVGMTLSLVAVVAAAAVKSVHSVRLVLYGVYIAFVLTPIVCYWTRARQADRRRLHSWVDHDSPRALHGVAMALLIASVAMVAASFWLMIAGLHTPSWACLGVGYSLMFVGTPAVVALLSMCIGGRVLSVGHQARVWMCSLRLYWSFLTLRLDADVKRAAVLDAQQ